MRSSDKMMVIVLRDPWADVSLNAGHEKFSVKVNIEADSTRITATWRVSLLVSASQVVAAALVRRRSRSGAFDVLIELAEMRELASPVLWESLKARLPDGISNRLELARAWNGVIPPKTGEQLVKVLDELSPGLADTVAELRQRLRPDDRGLSPGLVNSLEQRDAVALGLEMAGVDSREALAGYEVEEGVPFLVGLSSSMTNEAAIIRHDASRFTEWMEVDSHHFDVWRYVDPAQPSRRMTVLYADKGPLELRTGTDLIYFREETQAFILVQYKRMKRRGKQPGVAYRPDKQLDVEIARMDALGLVDSPAVTVDEVRLAASPFYFKLVEPDIKRPTDNRLAKGMYFPMDLFQMLRNDPASAGPKGGVSIGWHNARRYLTNGLFVSLVQESWIGTRGTSSDVLSKVIREELSGDRGVIVVHDQTKSAAVSRRRA